MNGQRDVPARESRSQWLRPHACTAHHDLVRRRLGVGHLLPAHHLGAAVLAEGRGPHARRAGMPRYGIGSGQAQRAALATSRGPPATARGPSARRPPRRRRPARRRRARPPARRRPCRRRPAPAPPRRARRPRAGRRPRSPGWCRGGPRPAPRPGSPAAARRRSAARRPRAPAPSSSSGMPRRSVVMTAKRRATSVTARYAASRMPTTGAATSSRAASTPGSPKQATT